MKPFENLMFLLPIFRELIIYVHTEDAPAWRGYMYACFMFLAAVAQSLVLHQYFQTSFRLGMHIRTSLVAAVYRKVRCNHDIVLNVDFV